MTRAMGISYIMQSMYRLTNEIPRIVESRPTHTIMFLAGPITIVSTPLCRAISISYNAKERKEVLLEEAVEKLNSVNSLESFKLAFQFQN